MLLVGSFEPFDEEEARRVGANETLTKPFQSIRRLIDRVGHLVGTRPSEEQIPTAELPRHDETPEPDEKLSTAELEITTADTKPLPAELEHVVAEAAARQEALAEGERGRPASEASFGAVMESNLEASTAQAAQGYQGAGEVLLDLGNFPQGRSALDDEFVLDIDLDEIPEPSPAVPAFSPSAFRGRDSYRASAGIQPRVMNGSSYASTITAEPPAATPDQLATTQSYERILDEPEEAPQVVSSPEAQVFAAPAALAEPALEQLSPEMIDRIARRAVEQLSEKVVQEIAWEVVPQLAELLIKRQLEEKSS
jgi:hypothetical protein